jgi:ADP-heptose:LPS heptosyltransferase
MPRILIINPSALVEIVHGLQVVTSLREQWSADRGPLHIDWIVRDIFAPIVTSCSAVDGIFVFKRHGGTLEFLRLMKEVRAVRYDYVFDFQGLLRTGLMTWRTRARKKVGRSNAREGASAFYNVRVPLPALGRKSHKLDIVLKFLEVLDLKPELRGRLDFREATKLRLSFMVGRRGQKPIVMFPDARRPEKNWTGFKQLTKLILEKHRDLRVIWAGEHHLPDKEAFPQERFLNLTGNTSVLSLPALVQGADWVIANDSGPLHLAAALGVRNVGLFGPSDWHLWGAYPVGAPGNHIIQAPVGNLKLLQAKEVYRKFSAFAGLA